MPSNLTTVRAYSLENKERFNVVLVKYISNCCFISCKDKISSRHIIAMQSHQTTTTKMRGVVIIYDNCAVEPYTSRDFLGLQ